MGSGSFGTRPSPDRRPLASHVAGLAVYWVLPVALLFTLGWMLLRQFSLTELADVVSEAHSGWILGGFVLYFVANILRAARMSQLLEWPYSRALRLVPVMFVVSLFNNVLPMRSGELSFLYLMRTEGVEYGSSLAALLVSRIFDLLTVCSLFIWSVLAQSTDLTGSVTGVLAASAAMGTALIILLYALPTMSRVVARLCSCEEGSGVRASTWREAVYRHADRAATSLEILRSRRAMGTAAVHSVVIWLATYAWFAAFLQAIGVSMGFVRTITGASFAAVSKALPIGSIGGFGTHEAGWALGFTLLGQDVAAAILSGFAVNVLTLVASALFGLASLIWLGFRSGKSAQAFFTEALGKPRTEEAHPTHEGSRANAHRAIILVLVLFVLLGILYSVVTPLFETPDEVWHYLYVKHYADGKGLPVYAEGVTFPMRQEASQPPLYYMLNGWATGWIDSSDADIIVQYNPHAAIGAPSAWGNRNVTSHTPYEDFPYRGSVLAAHVNRFFSVLMGAGTVLCTHAIARRLFPRPGWLAPAAAALNAFVPQFVFISASVNNDVLATLLSAISLWLLVCIAQDGASTRRLCALGVLLGLAALSKLNALVLFPLTAVAFMALTLRQGGLKSLLRWSVLTYASAAVVGAWWYARNWVLYGDPFGLDLMFAVLPKRAQGPALSELLRLLDGAVKSFFGVFGWFNIAMEPWTYTIFMAGLAVGVLGLVRLLFLRVRSRRWSELLRIALLGMWSAAYLVALVGWTQARYPQGRLLFPAMPAMVLLWLLGFVQWLRESWSRGAVLSLMILLAGFALVVPHRYIAPAYARAPRLNPAEREAIANPLDVVFGDKIRLLGYDLAQDDIQLGTPLWLTLYWEGLVPMDRDYSVFVHVVDARGVTVAQRDSYPGSGNDPTRSWTVGEAIRDLFPIDVPAALLAAGPFRIRLGLYEYSTGQRLHTMLANGEMADDVELPVSLHLRREPSTSAEAALVFEKLIALTHYSADPLVVEPGGSVRIVLRWEAMRDVKEDYKVFAQLLRAGDQIWAQSDHVPVDGLAPTRTWTAGQIIVDEFELKVSADAPNDVYELVGGLYRESTVVRLGLPDGTDTLLLGHIVVSRK